MREPLHQHVQMRKHQQSGPDPFTLAEVGLLLDKMPAGPGRNYFELAFFCGLRPSELIALRWAKVDLPGGTLKVDTALTRGREKGTKTGNVRMVELTKRAHAVLERQRAVTQLAGGHVFLDALA